MSFISSNPLYLDLQNQAGQLWDVADHPLSGLDSGSGGITVIDPTVLPPGSQVDIQSFSETDTGQLGGYAILTNPGGTESAYLDINQLGPCTDAGCSYSLSLPLPYAADTGLPGEVVATISTTVPLDTGSSMSISSATGGGTGSYVAYLDLQQSPYLGSFGSPIDCSSFCYLSTPIQYPGSFAPSIDCGPDCSLSLSSNPPIPQDSGVLGLDEQQAQQLQFIAAGYSLGLTCAFSSTTSCLESLPSAALAIPSGLAAFQVSDYLQNQETQLFQSLFGSSAQDISEAISYIPFLSLGISILEGSTNVQIPLSPIQFTTTYTASPPNVTVTNSTPYNSSPTGQVFNGNYGEAPNYLTCPTNASSLNPTTDLYFYANKNTGIAGDKCLTANTTFSSTLYGLTTSVSVPPVDEFFHILSSVGSGGYITGVSELQIANPGAVSEQDLGYSPSVDGVLSNGFNTSSYIFDKVPSFAQHGIWSWNLVLPDFSAASVPASSNLFFTMQTITEPGTGGICLYTGPYFEQTTLDSVNTNYIPFTEIEHNSSSTNYNSSSRSTFDTAVYPFLLYSYVLTQDNAGPLSNPNLTGMSEDIYSPWNYYTPANSEDQFPIDLPSLLFARSTTKGNQVITIPENGTAPENSAIQTPVAAYRTSPSINLSIPSTQIYSNYSFLTSNAFYLTLLDPIAAPGIVTQGSSSLIVDDPAIGGTPPYKYQWSVESPGSSSYSNITSANSITYDFQTAWNSTIGTYNFRLTANDSTMVIDPITGALVLQPLNITKDVSVTVVSSGFSITDPISITATANNYIYVLYDNSGNYTIGVIRLYPHGSYPASVPLPSTNVTCGGTGSWSGSSCSGPWDAEWQAYWDQVIEQQNNTAYLMGTINIPSVFYAGGNPIPFVPYNITSDNSGDIFITGETVGRQLLLAKVLDILTPSGTLCYESAGCDRLSWSPPISVVGNLTEIAAAPVSGDIYLTGPGSQGIYVFSANNFTLLRTLPLVFSNDTALAGSASPLSQTANSTPLSGDLNITKWLRQTGPFGINGLQTASGPGNSDKEAYHHPLSIADVNGDIYLLDDWSGSAGGNGFDFLTLRVMDANGTEVPLNPSILNDVSNLTARQLAQLNWETQQGLQYEFPPYGIILSGEVNGVSFCSSSTCDYHREINQTYYPIGPMLNQSGCDAIGSICPVVGFSTYPDGRVTMLMPPQSTGFGYGELLVLNLNPENYTQLLSGLPPYICYVPSNIDSGICGHYNISQIAPPIYGVDDTFKYLENLGSQNYLSFSNQYFAEFSAVNSSRATNQACFNQISNFSNPSACYVGGNSTFPAAFNVTKLLNSSLLGNGSQPRSGNLTLNYTVLENVTSTLESHLSLVTNQSLLTYLNAFLGQATAFGNETLAFNQSYSNLAPASNLTTILDSQLSRMTEQFKILNNESVLLNNQTGTNASVTSPLAELQALEAENKSYLLNETKAYLNQIYIYIAEKNIEAQEYTMLTGIRLSNGSTITPPVTELTSEITGNAWLSYQYRYDTFQWWGPYILTGGEDT
ncbi:MAG TPA: hypothetical protein VL945_00550, partial [Candidatus Saccharimonadales bacterium]|nr:hypothetical protein [Candidatus Saccharimonadales bacterium]